MKRGPASIDYTSVTNYDQAKHEQIIVNGDTVNFVFHSDGSGQGYGYYAIVTGLDKNENLLNNGLNVFYGEYKEPEYSGAEFTKKWYLDAKCTKEADLENITDDMIVYAGYEKKIPEISSAYLAYNGAVLNKSEPAIYNYNLMLATDEYGVIAYNIKENTIIIEDETKQMENNVEIVLKDYLKEELKEAKDKDKKELEVWFEDKVKSIIKY